MQKLINLNLEYQIRINTINVTSLPRQSAVPNKYVKDLKDLKAIKTIGILATLPGIQTNS